MTKYYLSTTHLINGISMQIFPGKKLLTYLLLVCWKQFGNAIMHFCLNASKILSIYNPLFTPNNNTYFPRLHYYLWYTQIDFVITISV